jgi:hypothetical protein
VIARTGTGPQRSEQYDTDGVLHRRALQPRARRSKRTKIGGNLS